MDITEKIKRVVELRKWCDDVKTASDKEKYVHCVLIASQVYKTSFADAKKYVSESLSYWPEVSGALDYAQKLGII